MKEIIHINAQTEETLKLRYAVDQFAHQMFLKLRDKEYEGYEGWDIPDDSDILLASLQDHMEKPLTSDNLVDIANLCMMCWCHGGIKEEKEDENQR